MILTRVAWWAYVSASQLQGPQYETELGLCGILHVLLMFMWIFSRLSSTQQSVWIDWVNVMPWDLIHGIFPPCAWFSGDRLHVLWLFGMINSYRR